MDPTFNYIAGIASIVSLIISIFALVRVNKVKKNIQQIKGDGNVQAGHDIKI